MTKSSTFSAAATAIAAIGVTSAAYTQPATNTSASRPAKNVVLVHGAFADGSGWRGVYDGFGILNPEKFKAGFAADTSDADAAFLRDTQVPINMSVFATTLNNAAWRTKPSWAVIATDDKAFDQRMLHMMAKRIGATITEVKASHAVFMTQPKVIADVIEQAARNAVQTAR